MSNIPNAIVPKTGHITPRKLNFGFVTPIGDPPVIIYANPLHILIVANVVINAGTRNFAVKIPLNSPIAIPSAKATINVKHVLSVVLNTIALITPINAYIEPTDRSISPKRMIMNIPREDIPVMETCLST